MTLQGGVQRGLERTLENINICSQQWAGSREQVSRELSSKSISKKKRLAVAEIATEESTELVIDWQI
jgi:hypothetical protein